MKIVIDIPDDEYAEVKALRYPVLLEKSVQDGKPLDEVLADIKEEIKEYSKKWLGLDYYDGIGSAIEAIDEYIEKESERNIDQENE